MKILYIFFFHQNHQILWILHFFEENCKKTQKYLVISNIPFIFAT